MDKDTKAYRPRYIGAGTVVALAVALLVGLYQIQNKKNRVVGPPAPARQAVEFKLPNGPDMEAMLLEGDRLKLRPEQKAALRKLKDGWSTESAPIAAEMKRLDAEMSAFLDGARKKRVAMEEIQKRGAPLSDSTEKYAALRDVYQKRALDALDAAQREEWEKIKKGSGATGLH